MKMKKLNISALVSWTALAALALLFMASAARGLTHRCSEITLPERVVEVVRTDTLVIERPVPVWTRIVDTILVPIVDTVHVHDTAYIALGIERKEYRDSTYAAVISGYRPELERIEVYPRTVSITKTITETARNRRFGLGIHAGYGVTSEGLSPYVGAGLSYNLFTF